MNYNFFYTNTLRITFFAIFILLAGQYDIVAQNIVKKKPGIEQNKEKKKSKNRAEYKGKVQSQADRKDGNNKQRTKPGENKNSFNFKNKNQNHSSSDIDPSRTVNKKGKSKSQRMDDVKKRGGKQADFRGDGSVKIYRFEFHMELISKIKKIKDIRIYTRKSMPMTERFNIIDPKLTLTQKAPVKQIRNYYIARQEKKHADFKGNYTYIKKSKKMHPSIAYLKGKRQRSMEDRQDSRKKHLNWIALNKKVGLKKNHSQPTAVKQKVKKPKYDSREAQIWND